LIHVSREARRTLGPQGIVVKAKAIAGAVARLEKRQQNPLPGASVRVSTER